MKILKNTLRNAKNKTAIYFYFASNPATLRFWRLLFKTGNRFEANLQLPELFSIQRVLTFRMGNINFVIITGKLGACVRQEKVISGGGGGGGVRGGGKGI